MWHCRRCQFTNWSRSPVVLIPRPQRMIPRTGTFQVGPGTAIRAGAGTERAALLLRTYMQPVTGAPPRVSNNGDVSLTLDPHLVGLGDEGYSLMVSPQAIVLRAASHA